MCNKMCMAVVIFAALFSASLNAKHSDSFLLGNYSFVKSGWYNNGHAAKVDSLTKRMHELGYNATVCEHSFSATDVNLQSLLGTLDSDSLDAILIDQAWDEVNDVYGTESLTLSNYWRFEAEYDSTSTINGNTDRYFSINSNTTGSSVPVNTASGDNILRLINNQPGYALNKLEYRWIGREYNSNDFNDLRYNVGPEFRFIKRGSVNPWIDDTLYVTIAFWCENYPANPTLPLIQFSFNGYESESSTQPVIVNHTNPISSIYGSISQLTVSEFEGLPTIDSSEWLHKTITLEVRLADLDTARLLNTESSWKCFLKNLNPQLFWMGHGVLEVDYVEFEDSVHRRLLTNQEFRDDIETRVNSLATHQNIKYLYLQDEPTQGQFDTFREIYNVLLPSSNSPAGSIQGLTTCINMNKSNVHKSTGVYNSEAEIYNHIGLYDEIATPNMIMFDIYPLKGGTFWNNDNQSHSNWIQKILDKNLLYYYQMYKQLCLSSNNKFVPVVQSYGRWDNNGHNWMLLRPLRYMQKCLKLLPLCYGADGIMDYRFQSEYGTDDIQEYSLINMDPLSPYTIELNGSWWGMKEANEKILHYHNYLKDETSCILSSDWLSAGCILTTGVDNSTHLATVNIDSLYVKPQVQISHGVDLYDGYIQYGMYNEDSCYPYLFLVNRRTEFVPQDGSGTSSESLELVHPPDLDTNNTSITAPPQTLHITPSGYQTNPLGTHLGFFDPFDNRFYDASEGGVDIEFEAGDGKLLRMCATLPQNVVTDETVNHFVVLDGDIAIEPGINVTISSGAKTRVKKNACISVGSGSCLTIRGEFATEDSVRVEVTPNGSLVFDNANCTWGQGSVIEVTGGSLNINGGSMNSSDSLTIWAGIRASFSSLVVIHDAIISDAEDHQVISSNLLISNARFNIPENSRGLTLGNRIMGYLTQISNTEPGRGFYGQSNRTSEGICLTTMNNSVYISNVDFQNLYYGILKSENPCATDSPYATNAVSDCRFVNCTIGVSLLNNINCDIQQCSFANNKPGKQGTGIYPKASSPTISSCDFTNLYRGILTEFSLISGLKLESSVNESNFYNCEMGIESRNSNHRLKANYFNRNNSGIVNHAGSNLNLSYDANNVLMNHIENIVFYDTMPYESTIQIFTGHNDFYQLTDNSTSLSALDFSFDTNYYNFPVTPDFKINASKNWFQDAQVTFNDPAYVDYVYVDTYDPSPTIPAPPPENDRLFIALGYESQELYELACATYQAIIDDQLEEEQTYITSAIDGLYRCIKMIPNPAWELTDYFETKALQFAIDEPTLSAILKDYLAKVFVLNKDFQAAVDLIQLRIDNPISEIDSLRAVLDLEIVLQLAAMEEDKRPLTTKYVQYQYPDIQVFDVMHSNNWDMYNRALRQNDQETNSVIAPTPQIQSNYPNPFNPSTTIAFSIPETGRVRVSVYNIKGQKVKDLLNTEMTRGNHRLVWDGRDTNNRNVASGIYFIKLESGGKTSIRKAMLMK